jgi:hypothetical protein
VVRVVRRARTRAPQTEVLRASSAGEGFETVRVPASPPVVEVGRRGSDRHEADVDVDSVARANDVAKEPAILVDAVSRGLGRQPDPSGVRHEPFRRGRRLMPEALGLEVHLGRVDLDEADVLAVGELDRVAVDDPSDPVRRERRRSSTGREDRQGEDEPERDGARDLRRAFEQSGQCASPRGLQRPLQGLIIGDNALSVLSLVSKPAVRELDKTKEVRVGQRPHRRQGEEARG